MQARWAQRSVLVAALAGILGSCALDSGAHDGAPNEGVVAAIPQALIPSPDSLCTSADFDGKKYFFCANDRSWQAAETKCNTADSNFHLASIETSAENAFIRSHIVVDSWVSGTDAATEGTWVWQTGAQFWLGGSGGSSGGQYANWATGQPNNTFNQDCMLIDDNSPGKWSDESCTSTRDYVCEGDGCPTDANKTDPGQCGCGFADTDSDDDGTADCADDCDDDPDKNLAGQCGCGFEDTDGDGDGIADCVDACPGDDERSEAPCSPDSDCEHVTFDGHSYFFCDNARTWSSASSKCEAVGMMLARIDSDAENDFIADEIATDRWIGGTDASEEGAWHWTIAGEQFWQGDDEGSAIGGFYENWNAGQPNNLAFGAGEDCLQIEGDGDWWDDQCDNTEQYICEEVDVCGGCAATGDPCTVNFCDERSGTCLTAANDGASCDDGDPSTTDEICALGACVATPTGPDLEDHCGSTGENYAALLRDDPGFAAARQEIARDVESWTLRCSGDSLDTACSPVFRVPVVVHVVGDGDVNLGTGLHGVVTDDVIDAQIEQLNKDYRRMGGVVPSAFADVDADMEVEFVLAKRDPACQPTSGITRTMIPSGSEWCLKPSECPAGIDIQSIKRSADSPGQGTNTGTQHGIDAWNPAGYINIWVGEVAGVTARSSFPGEDAENDGVVIDYLAFGPQPSGRFHLAHTLSHELGHYFNLHHTFQARPPMIGCTGSGAFGEPTGAGPNGLMGGCNVDGDQVCDTPPQGNFEDGNEGACPSPSDPSQFLDACFLEEPDLPEMSMNFMDYTDTDCQTMFTLGQKVRLLATLNGRRAGLKNSAGLIPPPTGMFDLWVADGRDDLGNQPNTETEKMWKSSDIWVRHRHDEEDNQAHQNPIFLGPGETTSDGMDHNHVYVNVRNRGCEATFPTYVNLFWAKASSSLSWPAPWNGSEVVPGTSVPMGGGVEDGQGRNFREVPALQPGGMPGDWHVAKFDWTVPDPADYAPIGGNDSHFCLLALIDPCRSLNFDSQHRLNQQGQNACADEDANGGPGDGWPGRFTMEGDIDNPLIPDALSTNVRNQNNMAWKNVTVASEPDGSGASEAAAGVGGTPDGASALLAFDEAADFMGRDSIFDWGTVFVDLGPELYDRWEAGGSLGGAIEPAGGSEIELLASGAEIAGIEMEPQERFTVHVRFVPSSASSELPLRAHPDSYFLDMDQYAQRVGGDELVGGIQFVLKTYRQVAPDQSPD